MHNCCLAKQQRQSATENLWSQIPTDLDIRAAPKPDMIGNTPIRPDKSQL